MIDTVLFDLDGTLLPVHNDFFFSRYLTEIAGVIPGRTPEQVGQAIHRTLRDVMRDPSPTQRIVDRFAVGLAASLDMPYAEQEPHYLGYYTDRFPLLGAEITPPPQVRAALTAAREKGFRLVLATNPVFPGIATLARMAWAGLTEADFDLITFYEDCRYTKPHTAYYTQEVLERIGGTPERCLMVGNDAREDMRPARDLGMATFFLTPHAIGAEEPCCWDAQGDYDDMLQYILALPPVR